MIEEVYLKALISDASYIDFTAFPIINGKISEDYLKLFLDRGWTDAQFDWFVKNFEVEFHQPNTNLYDIEILDFGFSATLFKEINSDEYHIGFRGTEFNDGIGDLIQDINLGLGLSYFFGAQEADLERFFVNAGIVDSEGNTLDSKFENHISYSGHSLGGFLALIASSEFPQFQTNVSTYNGAGLAGFDYLIREYLYENPIDGSLVSNYVAEEEPDIVASTLHFQRPGESYDYFFIENPALVGQSHFMSYLVDSISAMRVMIALDNSLDNEEGINQLSEIMRFSENDASNSLEEFLQNIADMVGIQYQDDWEAMYQEITEVNPALEGGFTLFDMTNRSLDELVQEARTDSRVAYALENNLPFVLDSGAGLAIYEEPQYDYSEQSDEYIRDRAIFLTALFDRNYNDNTASGETGLDSPTYFSDIGTGEVVHADTSDGASELDMPNVVFGSNAENDSIAGTTYDDRLYGRGGNDTINGGEGNDYIEGGDGIDLLEGGQGLDTLSGGKGFDTYYVGSTSERDIIIDSDGQGRIDFEGTELTGGEQSSQNLEGYINEDDGVRYFLVDGNLLIQSIDGGSIHTVMGFENGDLGITLEEYVEPQQEPDPVVGAVNIVLDESTEDLADPDGRDFYPYYDSSGANSIISGANSSIRLGVSAGSGNNVIHGSSDWDNIRGEEGNDTIYGNLGDDRLFGGSGNDWVYGGLGADSIYADERHVVGNDEYGSSIHPDNIDLNWWSQLFQGDETDRVYGGDGNDQISVNHGDDFVYGEAGDDQIFAGFGADQIYGGEGNDRIYSDTISYWHRVYTDFDAWTISRIYISSGDLGGDDIIDAGAGDDVVVAGYGSDFIDGGDGADSLQGDGSGLEDSFGDIHEHGDDFIYGGDGNDSIFGTGGDDVLSGGSGDDIIFGDDVFYEGLGHLPESFHGDDNILGGEGNDTIYANAGDDTVRGGVGEDTISGGKGADRLYGDEHNDIMVGGKGDDELYGGSGDDELNGEEGNDRIHGDSGDDRLFGLEGDDQVYGGSGNDELIGNAGDDYLEGGSGDDILWGESDNDTLLGGAGNDNLSGGSGNDILVGGSSSDALAGGAGDDTYIFNIGDGSDGLSDEAGNTTIRFGAGVTASDVRLSETNGHLFLDYSDGSDYIQLEDNSLNFIQRFEFSDGTSMSTIELLEREELSPVSNPTLDLDSSVDTDDISYTQINNNLVINYSGSVDNWISSIPSDALYFETTTDEILIDTPDADLVSGRQAFVLINWFASDVDNNVNEVSNGTDTISLVNGIEYESINAGTEQADYIEGTNLADTISSYEGNDYIESGFGDDHIDAGEGADFIEDDGGDDSYAFNQGDGKDVIFDASGNDTLSFGQGISVSDFTVTESVSGLLIQIGDVNDPNHDSLLLREWGWNLDSRIDSFVFSDGTSLTSDDIESMITGNHAPDLNNPIEQETAERDQPFSFTIPEDTFLDTEDGTELEYAVTLADGSDLPAWITYNEATRTLSGTPAIEDSGTWEFRIMVQDSQGLFNFHNFNIEVPPPEGAITGTIYDDVLEGDDNDNYIFGLSGDDIIRGNEGNDELFGSYGEDELYGGRGNDTLHGNLDDDELFGAEGNDLLHGNLGDDKLHGGEGDDILHGGEGDDFLYAGSGDDQLYGGEGNDYLASFDDSDWSEGGSDLFDGGTGNDQYNVSENSTIFLEVGDGRDYIYADGNLNINFGSGVTYNSLSFDTFIITNDSPNPSIEISYTETDSFEIAPFYNGSTVFTFHFSDGTSYSLTPEEIQELSQLATNGDDGISGDGYLLGLDGDDHITTSGQTIIDAGAGDDRIGSSGSFGYILLRAGDGDDSLIGINRSYPYPSEIAYMGNGNDHALGYGNDDIIYGEGDNDFIDGGNGDDILDGGQGDDVIYGGEGDDVLSAGDGNDQIYDALGDNTLRGGAGDDTYHGVGFYDDYFDGLVYSNSVNRILDTSGNDTLELMRTDEDYDSIASVRRAGNDLVIEASHDSENTNRAYIIQNWFVSADYHIETINVSDGSGGVTSLSPLDIEGMLENDGELTIAPDSNAYVFSTPSDDATLQRINNDLIIEFPDSNNNLTIEGWFNDQSDITEFRFSDGQVWYAEDINFDLSTLNGTSGDDHIESGRRRDLIDTGSGNDIVDDSGGDNVINTGSGNDEIYTSSGRDIIDAGAGDDRVVSGGGSIITGGLGNDDLVGGMGHELYHYNLGDGHDVITDLDGGVIFGEGISLSDLSFSVNTSSDEVIATIGNDEGQIIFRGFMADNNPELPPPLMSSSELPPPPVADVSYFGGLALGMELIFNDGTRTTLLNLLATQGTESSDTLNGTPETDVLLGYGGNDTIDGLEGADYIFGGSGSDTIYGNDGSDLIEGDDGDDYLYGGQGDDFINGGVGSDSLYGGVGNDELDGFFGNDFLQGGAGNDTYYFYRGQGNDTIDNYDQNSNSIDVLRIDPSITSDQVSFEQVDDNLILTLPDGETLTILNHFLGGENSEHAIDLIEFFDGTVIERADIGSLVPVTGTDADDDIEGTNANDTIDGAGGDDKLRGFDGDDNLFGGVGDDKIYGDDGSDILDGGDGRDFLTAGRGNDQLYGGLGDDRLSGSYGSDTFYYNLGDGSDWVQNSQVDPSDIDTISLGDGIGLEDIVLSRSSENLVIEFNDGGQITVQWQFKEPTSSGTVYSIDRIEFSDGSVLEQVDIDSYFTTATNNDDELHGDSTANSIDGLDGNDSIYGYSGEDLLAGGVGNDNIRAGDDNDIIYGNDGNDSLYGENGDDIIHGGLGNDHMSGGNGSDTYHFARGEGDDSISNSDYSETSIDTIQLATGILPEDVSFSANSAHLVITLDTGEKLTIYSHFNEDRYAIDVIEFDNGEVVTKEDIKLLFSQETEESDSIFGDNTVNDVINGLGGSDRIYGLDGDDYLDGGDGNDLMYGGGGSDILIGSNGRDNLNAGSGADELTGGLGDDTLFGNNGDDIYHYSAGDGNDTIFDQEHSAGGLDVISFDNTITLNDISFEQNGSDLLLNLSSGEVITIQRYYDNEFWRIERLEFSDGTFLSLDSVDSLASTTSEKATEPAFIEQGQMNLQQNNQFYVTQSDRGPTWRRLLSEHEITEMTTGMIESFILGEKKNNAMSIPNKDPSGMFVNDYESDFNIKNSQDRMVPNKNPEGMFVDEQGSAKNHELRMVPNKTPEGMFLDNETLVGGFSQNELSQTLEGAKFFDLLLQQSSFSSNEEKLTEASNVEHYEESQPVITIPYL